MRCFAAADRGEQAGKRSGGRGEIVDAGGGSGAFGDGELAQNRVAAAGHSTAMHRTAMHPTAMAMRDDGGLDGSVLEGGGLGGGGLAVPGTSASACAAWSARNGARMLASSGCWSAAAVVGAHQLRLGERHPLGQQFVG